MILDSVLDPFVEQRPVCVLARGILERLLDPDRIDELFQDTAENGYTRTLQFSTLVQLMVGIGAMFDKPLVRSRITTDHYLHAAVFHDVADRPIAGVNGWEGADLDSVFVVDRLVLECIVKLMHLDFAWLWCDDGCPRFLVPGDKLQESCHSRFCNFLNSNAI